MFRGQGQGLPADPPRPSRADAAAPTVGDTTQDTPRCSTVGGGFSDHRSRPGMGRMTKSEIRMTNQTRMSEWPASDAARIPFGLRSFGIRSLIRHSDFGFRVSDFGLRPALHSPGASSALELELHLCRLALLDRDLLLLLAELLVPR